MFAKELFCPSSLWTITLTKALSTSPNTRTVKQRTRKKQCTNPDSETRKGNIVKIDEKDRHLNPFQAMFTSQGSRKGIGQRFSSHTIKTLYMVPCVTIQPDVSPQGRFARRNVGDVPLRETSVGGDERGETSAVRRLGEEQVMLLWYLATRKEL